MPGWTVGAVASTKGKTRLLLRDFIHNSLYNPIEGYFVKSSPPIAQLPEPIDFNAILGRSAYQDTVAAAYQKLKVAWLTPSEIFSPHYGNAIANYILQEFDEKCHKRLEMFEIGGGTGTLAKDILDTIRQERKDVYQGCSYTVREISRTLGQLQKGRLESAGHERHFRVEIQDAAGVTQAKARSNQHCFIIGTEVLDNCAHDRLVRNTDGSWMAEVVEVDGTELTSHLEPVSDEVIQSCLDLALSIQQPNRSLATKLLQFATGEVSSPIAYTAEKNIFLPTKASMLLKAIATERPNHTLLLADFDQLPEVVIPGRNAPLVSTTVDGKTVDHDSYLVPPGSADIFFPTDFRLLQKLYNAAAGSTSSSEVLSNIEFMKKYANLTKSMTRNGYNPLVEDYTNTAFLLGSSN